MAIDPSVEFPGKIDNTAPADYPYGKARNITTPGDGTGTPFVANLLNDLFGMQQALLDLAGLTPSGVPDTVQASQYLEALKVVAPRGYFFDDVVGAGTFTPPVGVTRVKVTVMGGGGGGGTAEQITADGPARPGGGGGGGGGVGVTWLEMPDPFNPIEIGYTIGQGGAEGATGDQSEALRNDTTGTLVLAQGGGAGQPSSNIGSLNGRGAAGGQTSATIGTQGAAGTSGTICTTNTAVTFTGTVGAGGQGGAQLRGSGGAGAFCAVGVNGSAFPGQRGMILVEW